MDIYAFKDTSNITSSSGGAFPAILKAVEEMEGRRPIVYGAAFDDCFDVRHIRAVSEEDFQRLRGSKYVKSTMGSSIGDAVSDLMNGEIVVFSGTPCQIAGMKKRVEQESADDSKLYLIDIVCHGTPQQRVWKDFKSWLEGKYRSKLTDFSFRYAPARWKRYPTMASFENGKRIVNGFKLRRYTELFYSDLALESACYNCHFANTKRPSDITIGDFWGIRKVIPQFPYKEEVSQILPNTSKGNDIVDALKRNSNYIVGVSTLDKAQKYQMSFLQPTKKPDNVGAFWQDYQMKPFERVLKEYAGYNFCGMCKYCIKRFLGETKILLLVKSILKK